VEFEVVAQLLQPAHEALLRVVTISPIKVIAPQLFIALVLAQSSYPICAILLNPFQNKQDRQVRSPARQCGQQVALLVKRSGLIAVEALVVRSMVKNPKLAKSAASVRACRTETTMPAGIFCTKPWDDTAAPLQNPTACSRGESSLVRFF
jgi:hypothetical protein